MRSFWRHGVPLAVAALAVSGCASMRGKGSEGQNPTAQKVQTPQQQSEQALEHASAEQKKASEEASKAAAAQKDVQQKQQELQAAQQKAQQESQKAEQMQQQANRETQQATRQAEQSQHAATAALAQQSQQAQRGLQTLQGSVQQSTGRQLVVQPQGGTAMSFDLTPNTQIRIDGRHANASEIQPGENALVSYEVSGTQPTARSIQIVTGNTGAASSGGASTGSTPGGSSGSTGSSTGTGSGTSGSSQ